MLFKNLFNSSTEIAKADSLRILQHKQLAQKHQKRRNPKMPTTNGTISPSLGELATPST